MKPQEGGPVKFFIGEGMGEYGQSEKWATRDLPVKVLINFRGFDPREEDYDFWGQWLHGGWTPSAPAPEPIALAVNPPELNSEILERMTTFWTLFMQEPDSIRTTARRAHLREVSKEGDVPGDRHALLMTDMAALAAKYPSVAADLKKAELTASGHDAYRISLLVDARWTQAFPPRDYPVLDDPDTFLKLWATGMFITP